MPSKALLHVIIYIFIKYPRNFRATIGQFEFIIKEIKNAPECIVELYKHVGIFNNTSEVPREARGEAECFSHFSSVLRGSYRGDLWHGSRTEKTTNHESRISKFPFPESRKSARKTLFYLVLTHRKVS